MHRTRFGGNARKRKAKLTDATFHAMIGVNGNPESSMATIDEAVTLELTVVDVELDVPIELGAATPLLHAARPKRRFACQDYQFGYATCRACHNEQAYYVHHDDLAVGYTFRCRVCCLEMTVSESA